MAFMAALLTIQKAYPMMTLCRKEASGVLQVHLDKRDAGRSKFFKIDILVAARCLNWLNHYHDNAKTCLDLAIRLSLPKCKPCSSRRHHWVYAGRVTALPNGFSEIQPSCLSDVAKCIANIRPAARQAKIPLTYDDDVISLISTRLGVDEFEADRIRRLLGKRDPQAQELIVNRLGADAGESSLSDRIYEPIWLLQGPRHVVCAAYSVEFVGKGSLSAQILDRRALLLR